MMRRPLFSICIPTRNRARFLKKAVESGLDQSYDNIEIVIVDNDSADDTEQVGRAYADADPRVKYFKNERNIGQTLNIFKAFQSAGGDYVQYLADDNWLDENYAEEKVRCFAENPDAGLVTSACLKLKWSESGMTTFMAPRRESGKINLDYVCRHFYRSHGWFGFLGSVRRKDMLLAIKALYTIPNPYGYNFVESGMGYDLMLPLYILSQYPYMIHSDRTVFYDLLTPSEVQDLSISNWVEYQHRCKVLIEHTFSLCGLPQYIPAYRRYTAALLAAQIMKRLLVGPRTGIGFSTLPRFYKDLALADWPSCLLQVTPIAASSIFCGLKHKFFVQKPLAQKHE